MAEIRTERSAARVRERGIELLEEAAEQSRPRIVAERVVTNARWFVQAALATALAWEAAIALFGHSRPIFAPVAALIAVSTTLGQRRRYAVEMVVGIALGIGIAEITSVETLSRAVVRALRLGDNVPAPMPDAIRDLSSAVRRLDESLDDPSGEVSVREPALRAAAQATLVLEQTGNLSVNAIVVQVRAAAVDLLRGSGVTREESERLVREAARSLA